MNAAHLLKAVSLPLIALLPLAAFGSWDSPGRDTRLSDSLSREAHDLNQLVQYSRMKAVVKASAQALEAAADDLAQCRRIPNPSDGSHHNEGDYSYGCAAEKDQAIRAFSLIDHQLDDTYNDYPSVYREYSLTRDIVNRIQNEIPNYPYPPAPTPYPTPYPTPTPTYPPVPAPGPSQVRADGSINAQGYSFIDYDRRGIFNQCMNFTASRRIMNVHHLTVNSQSYQYTYGISPESACQLVSQNAN